MITLEISSTDIRLMEVSGGKVEKWASRSLESGMFEEEVIIDPRALGAAVKQLMDSSGIKEKKIIASVSGLYSLSRVVTIATPLEQSVTEQAVLEATEEVMPLSEEEMYFSWQTVAPGEGGQQVLVVGVPRDVIDSEVQALRAVGINPSILDIKTLALARAVNREQALILNIDTLSFDIVIVVSGVAEVLRTIAWQMEDLSVEERVEHLVSALGLTVSFYDSHHPNFPLDPATPLIVTGQMSGNLALVEQLQDEVEYAIEPLAPPLEYPEHLPISQYAVNVGLALKATATSRINIGFRLKSREAPKDVGQSGYSIPDINLLPQVYRAWRPSARQTYSFLAVAVVLALLFPLYQLTTAAMAETTALKQRYTAINSVLDQRKAELSRREPLQAAINEYNSIVAMGGSFIEDLEVIRSLAEELDIEVASITLGGSNIFFTCQAPDYIIFREFLTALEESGRVSSVTPPDEQVKYPPEHVESGTITLKSAE
ncbi:type IV pilus biogenesis protein PilM [Chloroflexota bacterium]